jgi:hypothetical protein
LENIKIGLNLLATAILACLFPVAIQVLGLEVVRRMLDIFFARRA